MLPVVGLRGGSVQRGSHPTNLTTGPCPLFYEHIWHYIWVIRSMELLRFYRVPWPLAVAVILLRGVCYCIVTCAVLSLFA